MQAAGMTLKVPVWCQVITALSRPARRGQALAEEAHQLWQELQQSGLLLDAKSLVIGQYFASGSAFQVQVQCSAHKALAVQA